ncbi:unnamed protein product, partial [Polarella glacialis]
FLAASEAEELLAALTPQLGALPDGEIARLLFALAMADVDIQHPLARVLAIQYTEGRDRKDPSSDVDVAWALCAFQLSGRYSEALRFALLRICDGTPSAVAARRPWLIKLHDVVAHLQVYDPKAAKVVPALWREAASQAARLEAERLGASPVHKQ